MHIAAVLIGIVLAVFTGSTLLIIRKARATSSRELRSQGVNENVPLSAPAAAILAGHAFGLIIAVILVIWGLSGLWL